MPAQSFITRPASPHLVGTVRAPRIIFSFAERTRFARDVALETAREDLA
jgi:hypothetical protein